MANILLLGGTGAIGIYLGPLLNSLGHSVYCTTRGGEINAMDSDNGISYLVGNAQNKAWVSNVITRKRFDCIVDFMNYSTTSFLDRYEELLLNTDHYIFISSYRVYADLGLDPLNESSPRLLDVSNDHDYLATDEYALAKARQETILKKSSHKNWTIARPGITYSKARFQLCTLEANTVCFRALRGLPVALPSECLDKYTTLTWAGDVAKLIAALVLHDSTKKEEYNVVSSEAHKWSEVLSVYESAIGLTWKIVSLEEYEQVVGGHYQIHYDRLFNRILDNAKILKAAGLQQKDLKPLSAALRMELTEFRNNPVYQYPNIHINAKMDRLLGSHLNPLSTDKHEYYEYAKHRYRSVGTLSSYFSKLTRRLPLRVAT